jgi:hypothetical protein
MQKILFILAILLLLMAVDAKEPKVGDYVNVAVGSMVHTGKITSINYGLMCMEAEYIKGKDGWTYLDECFGIGQITALSWVNQTVI